MSTGKAHAQASKALAPIAALTVGAFCQAIGDYLPGSVLAGLGAFLGCGIVGQILGPDLDQQSVTANEQYILKRLGILAPLGWAFVAYWSIYAWAIPHRHPISHWPGLGTAGRLVYLLWGPVWYIISRDVQVLDWAAVLFAGMVAGLVVSDTAHYVMDFRPKRRRAARRRR